MSDEKIVDVDSTAPPQTGDVGRWVNPLRELTRGIVAIALFALFATEIIWGFHAIRSITSGSAPIADQETHVRMVMDLLNIVVPPTVALFGAATGFYYGSRGR